MTTETEESRNLRAKLEAVAKEIGCTWWEFQLAANQHPIQTETGEVGRDEKPLRIGAVINLRREFPGTKAAEDDKGWTVVGYLHRHDGRFAGYELRRGRWDLQVNTISKSEAYDLVSE